MRRKKNKVVEQLITRAAEISMVLEENKALYRELDGITQQLIEMEILQAFAPGVQMTITDNFAKANTAFRVARINRYEMKIERIAYPVKEMKERIKKNGWEFPVKKKAKESK